MHSTHQIDEFQNLNKMRILHLTLKKKWFDLIAKGEKCVEYREIKPYWKKRLLVYHNQYYGIKEYDEVHFRNGYKRTSPFMKVEWKGLHNDVFEGKRCFAIELGRILEISW